MNETTFRPLTTGNLGTFELLFCNDQQVNCLSSGQFIFKMQLGRLVDIRKQLVERSALSVNAM